MSTAAVRLYPFLRDQEGAVTTAQAASVDVSAAELRGLLTAGWTRPLRGVYVQAQPPDPFRASLRAALLACPQATLGGTSAARVHGLWGLPLWSVSECPQLILPTNMTPAQRRGARTRYGLRPGERELRDGLPVTNLGRTVSDLAGALSLDNLVCVLDSALRLGWTVDQGPVPRRGSKQLSQAKGLANALSESALETTLRLLLIRAGMPPEVLQFRLFTREGECYARLDFAWPSLRVAVEADGREPHDKLAALYHDRQRQNDIVLAGWTVLRFTWRDVLRRPEWVLSRIRRALNLRSVSGTGR